MNDKNPCLTIPLLGISVGTFFVGIGKENLWISIGGIVLFLFTLSILITVACISVHKEKGTIRLHS